KWSNANIWLPGFTAIKRLRHKKVHQKMIRRVYASIIKTNRKGFIIGTGSNSCIEDRGIRRIVTDGSRQGPGHTGICRFCEKNSWTTGRLQWIYALINNV